MDEPILKEVDQPNAYIPMLDGIPLEMIRYFNIDYRTMSIDDKQKLSEIYRMISPTDRPISAVLLELQEIQHRIGEASLGPNRYGKLWQYLKINRNLNELNRQKSAYELLQRKVEHRT